MNKKIINAIEVTVDNVKYRSKLEARAAQILREHNVPFLYEPFKIEWLPSFKYRGKAYIHATYTPDFVIEDKYIIEMKGKENDVWPYKKKGVLLQILNNPKYQKYTFYEIKTITQLKQWIKQYEEKSL